MTKDDDLHPAVNPHDDAQLIDRLRGYIADARHDGHTDRHISDATVGDLEAIVIRLSLYADQWPKLQRKRQAVADRLDTVLDRADDVQAAILSERDACAGILEKIAASQDVASANFAALGHSSDAVRHQHYAEANRAGAAAIRSRIHKDE
jgi:hypothetical protein